MSTCCVLDRDLGTLHPLTSLIPNSCTREALTLGLFNQCGNWGKD